MSTVLIALPALAPAAAATEHDQVVVGSAGLPGLALTAGARSGPVVLGPRTRRPDQLWRFHPDDAGAFTTVVHPRLRGCLTAYSPAEVEVLECIGAQGQSWVEHTRPRGSSALESALHRGSA
ncbi:hypothetical protein Q5530_07485 [Saccharothrix sp. BKS2]|uniref:hypothetical protein n=1 Tax=Saccharothrix sp. BKS2 TaxID=3064400 RepID=UPI0039E9D19C